MMNKRTITAAALAVGLVVQTQGFAQVVANSRASMFTKAATISRAELAAQKNWRATMAKQPVPGGGCFHASYPNFVWENVPCQPAPLQVMSASTATAVVTAAEPAVAVSAAEPGGPTGATHDYVAEAQGLITYASGELALSGVTSVESVDTGAGGFLGPDHYSLQINTNTTNPDFYTGPNSAVCKNYSGCYVWQQFVYSMDADRHGHSAVYMEYWVYNYGGFASFGCPDSSFTQRGSSCVKNSNLIYLPDVPVTELGNVTFTASATPGGQDVVTVFIGQEGAAVTADDSVLEIGSVWRQAEFNVFGDGAGSEAVFNQGASIDVTLSLGDGTSLPPKCVGSAGTTLETNSLYLGPCQAFVFFGPTIQFSESTVNPKYSVLASGFNGSLSVSK